MTWTVVRQQGLGYAVWLRWAAVAHERDQKYLACDIRDFDVPTEQACRRGLVPVEDG